jgi:pyruvate formate lyase activating enzyme
VAVKQ